jgi:MFS family permease
MARSNQSWITCLSAALFFFYAIFQMSFFNTICHELLMSFAITPVQLGVLSSLYFYSDALFLFPAGILLDKFSTRTLLLSFMALSIISMFLFAHTHSIAVIALCRIIWGIGNAFAFLGCLRLAAVWFPPQRHALVMGLLVTIGMSGGIVAQTPFSLLVTRTSWQQAVLVFAIIGLIMWLIMYFGLKDKKISTHHSKETLHMLLKEVFSRKQNWLCGIYSGCLNLPILVLGALWGSFYLQQSHHISAVNASFIITFLFVGLIIGAPIIGHFSDRILSRRKPMIVGALFALIVVSCILLTPTVSSSLLLATLFFLLGFASSAQVLSYPTVAESNPDKIAATAMSIVAIIINIMAALMQPVFALLMKHQVTATNSLMYLSNQHALLMMPMAFVLSLMMAIAIYDTRCTKEVI